MDANTTVNLLLAHLAETTAERDAARQQLAVELTKMREEMAEMEKRLPKKRAPRKAATKK